MNNWFRGLPLCAVLLVGMLGVGLSLASVASAQDDAPAASAAADVIDAGDSAPSAAPEAAVAGPTAAEVNYALVNTILLFSAILVILMQAGFAMVEVGLNSAKNTVNILAKNLLDFGLGVLLFFGVGYGLMYPGADYAGKYFGFDSSRMFAIPEWSEGAYLHPQIDFLFQVAFAATAATIVSGAVAGRMKFGAYLVYTAVITGFVYPVSGMWKWGGGWLNEMGFWDFAGSGVVHMVGGFAGLAGAIVLGPRIGRYSTDGKSIPIPGHNITFTTLGVFLLLIGWYGFNPGSQFGAPAAPLGYADISAYGLIATNTTLAACAGSLLALGFAWGMFGKPDLTMALNGLLGGLVAITANCDAVTNGESLIIGAVGGVLVFFAVVALDKLKIDDPVGAFPVHGVCGMWALIACAAFGDKPWNAQLMGTAAYAIWPFVTMFTLFSVLKAVGCLRVSTEEETMGLDVSEHGMHAYPSDAIAGGAVH
ncbi:MAG: ammonium transporter [Planctomycetaceae bacterium]